MSFCSMSACEHMGQGAQTPEEKLQSIQNELIWGLAYRNYKENEKKQPISPMHSPINIPFELCRAKMLRKLPKKDVEVYKAKVNQEEEEEEEEIESKDTSVTKRKPKKRKLPKEKPTLLDRNVWSQNKYMDFLSLPNPKFYYEPKQKKYKKLCELEPCPPRFVQLAIPNKRRVYANWKDYADVLPTEMLMRYEEILHTDQNLDPKEARYYYKKLDRQKRKEKKQKKRLEKLKQKEKQKDSGWLKDLVGILAGDIVSYIQDEPLFALNYKQMLLSDGILERLHQTQQMKKPSRKTKNHYKKTVIEVSDKMAVWIDTLTRFVDVQAIDSLDDIPPVSISSLGEEGESEEGESYESTSDEDDKFFEKVEGEEDVDLEDETKDAEAVAEEILKPGEGEGPVDLEEVLNGLDGDILDKLIKILEKCSDDFLDSLIDPNQLPDITYRDVLERLKDLRRKLQPGEGEKSFLEEIMVDWAMKNDPDNVNDKVLKKIHEVAAILEDMLRKKGAGGTSEPEGEGEGTDLDKEGGEGEDKEDKEEPDEGGEGEPKPDEGGEPDVDKEGETPDAGEDKKEGEEGEGKDEEEKEGKEGEDKDEEEVKVVDEEKPKDGEEGEEKEDKEGEEGPDKVPSEIPDEEPSKEPDEEPDVTVPGEEPATTDLDEEPDATLPDEEDKLKPDESKEDKDEEGSEKEEGVLDLDKPDKDEEDKATKDEEDKTSKEEIEPGGDSDKKEPSETTSKEEPEEPSQEEPKEDLKPGEPDVDASRLDGKTIKGHKPPKVFEHSPDTVCCLSLKTWAVWLLEITHNAHNWTQWMSCVIQKVREFASIVRGEVEEPKGKVKVLKKAEWRKFTEETEESIVAWRQYSAHVKDLSQSIVDNFHDKPVTCCPKCLQDHLITNVVMAHDTLQALTEAISCAAYWQRSLDALVDKTCQFAQGAREEGTDPDLTQKPSSSESDIDEAVLEDVDNQTGSLASGSVYEIEGFLSSSTKDSLVAGGG